MKIAILCLYYDVMNLYGDTGNLKVITHHLDDLNIKYNVDKLTFDDSIDFSKYDLILLGSGKENDRELILKDLEKYKNDINNVIKHGTFFLVTGNSLGIFGKKLYGKKALGIFDFEVCESTDRISKEVIIKNDFGKSIYGFMNNSDVLKNNRNYLFENEGVHVNNFYGTYVLGPILARNPDFLKYFMNELVMSKDKNYEIGELDTSLEEKAYFEFIEFKKTKKFNSKKS